LGRFMAWWRHGGTGLFGRKGGTQKSGKHQTWTETRKVVRAKETRLVKENQKNTNDTYG